MDMKTLTGSSIQAALAKAREQLGDDVVLIESTPATGDRPAQIAVMVDEPASEAASAKATGQRARKHVPKPPDEAPATPSGRPRQVDDPSADSAGEPGAAGQRTTTAEQLQDRFGSEEEDEPSTDPLSQQQGTGRGRLFPTSGAGDGGNRGGTPTREKMIGARHRRIKDRLGGAGQREGVVDAERWAAHPLFGTLLDKGMRPETIARLFDDLAERGVDLQESDPEDLRWAFSQVLCRRIEVASAGRGKGAFAVIGPGGAGKTSLALKLAAHNALLDGRGTPAIIHLLPEDDRRRAYQNPTDLYQRFGLPVQGVRSKEEMMRALNRVEHIGQVIIDTPSLPLPLEDARPVLRRFEHLLRPLLPMDVHFVMSATHALDGFDAEALQQLPLTPSTTALTHLDEVRNWGRVAEWLLELGLPVQFVSEGPRVPEGARSFSLKWFVESVMDL